MARNDNNCSVPAGEDRSSAWRKEGPRLGPGTRVGARSSVVAALRTSSARAEDEGRRCRRRRRSSTWDVGARRGAPYGPRLGPGTRGGGGGAPGLETTAALAWGQGREATVGSGGGKLGLSRTGSRRKTTVCLYTSGDL